MARSKYEDVQKKLMLVQGWARDGLTDDQIAANLGISRATLYEYKKRHQDFLDAIKNGKEVSDYMVENALFQNAIKGDNVAIIFWLKNRRSDKWRDKPDAEERYKKLIALLGKLSLGEDEIKELVNSL